MIPIESKTIRLEADQVLVRVWKVAHELEDEKLALFDPTQSQLVILNALGAEFWRRLDGLSSLGEIAGEIADEVEAAPDSTQILEQSVEFLSDLIGRGAIAVR